MTEALQDKLEQVSVTDTPHERPDGEQPPAKRTRNRQNFSWRQLSVLEQVFETDPLPRPVRAPRPLLLPSLRIAARRAPRPGQPAPIFMQVLLICSSLWQALRIELAHRLRISPRCVQVWFQNRRQKWKTLNQAGSEKGSTAPPLIQGQLCEDVPISNAQGTRVDLPSLIKGSGEVRARPPR